jgi:5-methylcytosine-specific restriction endonuclease McrA
VSAPKGNLRRRVVARDGPVCKICGAALEHDEITLDHVIPRSKGGRNTFENLRVVCSPCNNIRGASDLHDSEVVARRAEWFEKRSRRKQRAARRKVEAPPKEQTYERRVYSYITNENAHLFVSGKLSFEEKLAIQKQDEDRLAATLAVPVVR